MPRLMLSSQLGTDTVAEGITVVMAGCAVSDGIALLGVMPGLADAVFGMLAYVGVGYVSSCESSIGGS